MEKINECSKVDQGNKDYKSDSFSNLFNSPIFILGPTGVGKTKVSLTLANILNGELINSDAFSLYKQADVLTAKATIKEREMVPHHLIDILPLHETSYNVNHYKIDCLKVIENIRDRKKSPIIVGGTNYYLESILFDRVNLCQENNDNNFNNLAIQHVQNIQNILKDFFSDENLNFHNFQTTQDMEKYLDKCDGTKLVKLLEKVDPLYSSFLHKNDTRRIKNGILYFFTHGRPKSDKFKNESIQQIFPDCLIIFLNPVLSETFYSRLKTRISTMLDLDGLVEVFTILNSFDSVYDNLDSHFSSGLLQAIGYKEFFPLYSLIKLIKPPNFPFSKVEEIKSVITDNNLCKVYEECKSKLFTNTLNYAKSQIKFIKSRLLPYLDKSNILDLSISDFSEIKFKEYQETIVEFILNNVKNNKNNKSINSLSIQSNKIIFWEKKKCDICDIVCNGQNEYQSHMKSNKHKKKKKKYRE